MNFQTAYAGRNVEGTGDWKVGAIVPACEGAPTKQQMDAILILDGECSAMEVWTMTPASKGGGRAD